MNHAKQDKKHEVEKTDTDMQEKQRRGTTFFWKKIDIVFVPSVSSSVIAACLHVSVDWT